MAKQIIWKLWHDPFRRAVLEKAQGEEDFEQEDGMPSLGGLRVGKPIYQGPAIVGPMGIIPLTEENLPSESFDLWVGHTNFDLTESVADLIECIDGVEMLRIWSRYRFWVGIGKSFEIEEVKKDIEDALTFDEATCACCQEKEKEPHEILSDYFSNSFSFWAYSYNDDATIEIKGGEDEDEVALQVAKWLHDGRVVESNLQ